MIRWLQCIVFCVGTFAQLMSQVYIDENGSVAFTSDAPLELIEAASDKLRCAIQPADRKFAFRVRMNSFQGFNSALQREHFNENYLESNLYPEAIFQGTIIEQVDLSQPGTYTIRAKGKLLVHGVYQERIIKSKVISDGKILRISSTFSIPLDDHDIEIPRIVNQKIAKEILVIVEATLAIKS